MISDIRITAEDIFHRAADMARQERTNFLDRACADNPELRREVEELLNFDQSGDYFLEKPAIEDAARELANHLAQITEPDAQSDTLREKEWTLGPYRILHEIGKGGMGIVYLGVDTRDERQVAIKVLPNNSDNDEDRLARFTREGRMLSELKSLKHPNIAEIYEQAEYDGKPCIVLEYVPGDTLSDRLRNGPLPINDALQFALQIADALKSAHSHRIVHRDLKPANVKITPEGRVKILDFGLAKRFYDEVQPGEEHQTRSISLTESGMLIGTPAYMSPEQWNGQAIDQRTDLWAFGSLLFEMLSGQAPFARKNRAETMRAVIAANPDWNALPKATPLVILGLIRQCFDQNPATRLADAGEARRMLAEAVTLNKFALSLYLKSQYWRLGQRTKKIIPWAAMLLALILAWQYTPLKKWVSLFSGSIVVTENDDLAVILDKKMNGANIELIRAAIMTNQQSSSDLLAVDESLRKNQDYPQAIDEIIQEMNEKIQEGKGTAWHYAIIAQGHLFKFYLTSNVEEKDAAVKAAQKAQELGAESFAVQLMLGELFNAIDAPDQAIIVFEKIRQNLPPLGDPKVLYGLARAYEYKQNDDQANMFYENAVRACEDRSPNQCALYYNELGAFHFTNGRYVKAAENWRKVTEQNPFNPFGYSNLGIALLYQGCINESIEACTRSINIKETIDGHSNRGMAFFFQGKLQEAIKDYERVTIYGQDLYDSSRHADLWGYLGDAYRLDGRSEQAIEAYRKAIQLSEAHLVLSPDDSIVIALKAEWIAKLYSMGIRDIQQSPTHLIEQALGYDPGCTECYGIAILVYYLSGTREHALQAVREAELKGYSPFLLTHNPEIQELRQEREIQDILRKVKPKC